MLVYRLGIQTCVYLCHLMGRKHFESRALSKPRRSNWAGLAAGEAGDLVRACPTPAARRYQRRHDVYFPLRGPGFDVGSTSAGPEPTCHKNKLNRRSF